MTKIDAIVFDIDGTILNTSEYIYQAYEHVLRKHGQATRTRKDIASQVGKKIEECYSFLAPLADSKLLIADHNAFQSDNLHLVTEFEQAVAVLTTLKDDGVKIGLWTGRGHGVTESLESAGFDLSLFDTIVMPKKDYSTGKPDPEGLFVTLKRLGVNPEYSIMVGDAAVDIMAGISGGVAKTVGLTHGFGTTEELEAAGADYIIDSLLALVPILDTIEQE